MQAAPSQTKDTHAIILFGVRLTPYSRGFVIAQYRSTLIMQRFRMEAVQESTSKETQTSQTMGPKDQRPRISQRSAIGMTRMATQRSLTARDTRRQLQGLRSFRTRQTATHTKILPEDDQYQTTKRFLILLSSCKPNELKGSLNFILSEYNP